jgi:hypothetical protein
MTRLLTAIFAFFAIVLLFSCNQNPKDSTAEKKMLSPAPPPTPMVDATLYLLYADISSPNNDMKKLVNSGQGGEMLVFQSYFKQNGQMALVAHSGKKNKSDFDLSLVPVVDTVDLSNAGVTYDDIAGKNIYISNEELVGTGAHQPFRILKDYLNSQHAENYLVFIPKIIDADSASGKKTIYYRIVALVDKPSTKQVYDSLKTLPDLKTEDFALPAGGILVNPCPPRCS